MTTLFDGPTDEADANRDDRLKRQIVRVYEVLLRADGGFLPLPAIAELADAPPASVSARMRDLRKHRFGGHIIQRKHLEDGLYAYRLVPDIGDAELVYNPKPEDRNPKPEAREAIQRYVRQCVQSGMGPDTPITTRNGEVLRLWHLTAIIT